MNLKYLPQDPILVTGANGFIGSALCRRLVSNGCKVRAFILQGTDAGELTHMNVELVRGDICKPHTLTRAFENIKTVFHLAALAVDWAPWDRFMKINSGGTWNVLEAARDAGVDRFVLMSSLVVHPFTGHVNSDETTPVGNTTNGYCMSKIVAESMTRLAQGRGWFDTTIIRPGAVIFGPGDTTAFVHLAPALKKGFMPLVGGGDSLMCYSYVGNLTSGMILAAANRDAAGQTYNINDDAMISWRDFLFETSRILGVRTKFISIPTPLANGAAWTVEKIWKTAGIKSTPLLHRYRVGLVARDFHFSCNKAKTQLGYIPVVGLRDGLERMVGWYRKWMISHGGSQDS